MGTAPTTYTLDSLATVLQLPAERLRAWVRAGLIRPVAAQGNLAQFDFRQVSAAKSLCDLLASGVTLGRVRKSLEALRHWRSEAEFPLEQLAILQRSGLLLVRLEDGELAETDGQYHFDFDHAENTTPPPMPHYRRPAQPPRNGAQAMHQEEQGLLAEAAGSYRRDLADWRSESVRRCLALRTCCGRWENGSRPSSGICKSWKSTAPTATAGTTSDCARGGAGRLARGGRRLPPGPGS